jgi:hypothetical protein
MGAPTGPKLRPERVSALTAMAAEAPGARHNAGAGSSQARRYGRPIVATFHGFVEARRKQPVLQKLGVAEYLVFPQISWNPKCQAVVQLRAMTSRRLKRPHSVGGVTTESVGSAMEGAFEHIARVFTAGRNVVNRPRAKLQLSVSSSHLVHNHG